MPIQAPPPGTPLGPGWLARLVEQINRADVIVPGPGISVSYQPGGGHLISYTGPVERLVPGVIAAVSGPPDAPLYTARGRYRPELELVDARPINRPPEPIGRPSPPVVPAAVGDACWLVRGPAAGTRSTWELWVITELILPETVLPRVGMARIKTASASTPTPADSVLYTVEGLTGNTLIGVPVAPLFRPIRGTMAHVNPAAVGSLCTVGVVDGVYTLLNADEHYELDACG